MIDLKNILRLHLNCLSSRASFKSVLMDSYPDEKRTVNILTIMFECGIVQKIKSKSVLGENDFQALLLHLENDYGIVSKYSGESIRIWADALGVVVQVTSKQTSTPIFNAGLEQIDVPPSCREIERVAFKECKYLSQILLHEGLTKIGDSAFENCKDLCAITIPSSVTEIGKQVFDITGWYQPYDRRRKGWSTREKSKDLIISCYAGSYGLDYARKEGYQIKNAAK